MIGISALLLALMGAPDCTPIPGSAAILDDPAVDYVILGEMHGTHETPAFFGDLVCVAAARRPVIVSLEIPRDDQPVLDAWLASSGDAAAQAALFQASFWSSNDGRSSVAMLALIERLRVMFQAKKILGVAATMDPSASAPGDQTPYERAMATGWIRARVAHPGARLVALVGNAHAVPGKVTFAKGTAFMAAASFLPRAHTATLGNADVGGTAWMCMTLDNCGPQPVGRGGQPWPRSIRRSTDQRSAFHWDYLFAPGTAFTAAGPAKPAQ
ncbi:hypothetical protein HZY97_10640 [Sphingomonas sp. R-74633]|uniref:hypothetical protein n=1 Tax=Sphingomonas sp. R-74633 TaxID=2751188 RepID=UPI0015D34578|nr:hypothetical protein [Sphingomonas sp. R-74633]NYT41215.1 hypothetical protein [Sphingomonas sp. R-74633]